MKKLCKSFEEAFEKKCLPIIKDHTDWDDLAGGNGQLREPDIATFHRYKGDLLWGIDFNCGIEFLWHCYKLSKMGMNPFKEETTADGNPMLVASDGRSFEKQYIYSNSKPNANKKWLAKRKKKNGKPESIQKITKENLPQVLSGYTESGYRKLTPKARIPYQRAAQQLVLRWESIEKLIRGEYEN